MLPKVNQINVNTGSLAGGQVLNIGGHGFGKVATAVNVDVDDLPCKVLNVDPDQITCLTIAGSSMQREVYRGGAGVRLEYYTENQSVFPQPFPVHVSYITVPLQLLSCFSMSLLPLLHCTCDLCR